MEKGGRGGKNVENRGEEKTSRKQVEERRRREKR